MNVSQSQEVDAVDDDEDNACEVTLSECRPKVGGRSFVWKQKLFLVDKNSRAVCGHCGDVVPARDGNTSNLVAHYESPRVVDPDGHKLCSYILTACKRGYLQSIKVLYMVVLWCVNDISHGQHRENAGRTAESVTQDNSYQPSKCLFRPHYRNRAVSYRNIEYRYRIDIVSNIEGCFDRIVSN